MGSTGLPSIETERLWLREIEEADLDEWAELTYGDPEMMAFMPVKDISGRERARRAFEFHAKTWSENDFGGWLITDKTDQRIMGTAIWSPTPVAAS